MNSIYVVKYSGGECEGRYESIVFATTDKDLAKSYVNKFNTILEKWKCFYRGFEENGWIKVEYIKAHSYRWHTINNISNCYFEEIPVR
jgi:hypothetical protein